MEAENLRRNLQSLSSEYGAVQRLADAIGIHRVQLSKILHGKAQLRVNQAERAAEHFGFTLRELLLPPGQFEKVKNLVA